MRVVIRRLSSVTAAGIVMALTAGLAAPASSAPAGVAFEDHEQALATDLALTAKAMGWTVAEARAQYEVAERIGAVQELIAARMPDAYVGAVLSDRPGGAPTLLLKGTADAFVREAVAAAGIPVTVADRQPYSMRELQKKATTVRSRLAALGYRQVVTAPDIAGGRVTAAVTALPGTPMTSAALNAALPADLRTGLDVAVSAGPVSSRETAVFGGMATTRNGLNRLVCTTGWSVTSGSADGVTTAAHCNNNQAVHDTTRHALNLVDDHLGDFGDVEWSTSTVPAPDDFFSNATTRRDVAAVEPLANITVGETVCVYGRSTNVRTCRLVLATGVTISDSLGVSEQLVAMDQDVTQGGDSGGGWSFDLTAYGSHVGDAVVDGNLRSAFSVADLYDEALGVRVRT